MEKKLPGVFVNKINTRGNNKNVFYESKEAINSFEDTKSNNSLLDIRSKIIDVFRSSHYIYKIDVKIKLKNKEIVRRVVGYNEKYLITFENEKILIDDILDIKIKED